MNLTTEPAESIFDLIKSVSPYTYPLLLSLIIPIFWVMYKKLLGISNNTTDSSNTTDEPSSNNLFNKIISGLHSTITLKGNFTEKILFYLCFVLFLFSGILLKVGERHEEKIRELTIKIKQNYLNQMIAIEPIDDLNKENITNKMLDEIVFKYPNHFTKDFDYTYLKCTDTFVIQKIHDYVFPLLESYLNYNFKYKNQIYIDSIINNPCINPNYEDGTWNVFQYFDYPIVYNFLGQSKYKDKYYLNVIDTGIMVIMKGDSSR